jgi:hypothetical protein
LEVEGEIFQCCIHEEVGSAEVSFYPLALQGEAVMAFGSSLIVDLDKQECSDRVPSLVAAGVAAEAGASVDRPDVVRPGTGKANYCLGRETESPDV